MGKPKLMQNHPEVVRDFMHVLLDAFEEDPEEWVRWFSPIYPIKHYAETISHALTTGDYVRLQRPLAESPLRVRIEFIKQPNRMYSPRVFQHLTVILTPAFCTRLKESHVFFEDAQSYYTKNKIRPVAMVTSIDKDRRNNFLHSMEMFAL